MGESMWNLENERPTNCESPGLSGYPEICKCCQKIPVQLQQFSCSTVVAWAFVAIHASTPIWDTHLKNSRDNYDLLKFRTWTPNLTNLSGTQIPPLPRKKTPRNLLSKSSYSCESTNTSPNECARLIKLLMGFPAWIPKVTPKNGLLPGFLFHGPFFLERLSLQVKQPGEMGEWTWWKVGFIVGICLKHPLARNGKNQDMFLTAPKKTSHGIMSEI